MQHTFVKKDFKNKLLNSYFHFSCPNYDSSIFHILNMTPNYDIPIMSSLSTIIITVPTIYPLTNQKANQTGLRLSFSSIP